MIFVFQHLGDLGPNKGSLLPKVNGTEIKYYLQQSVFGISYIVLLIFCADSLCDNQDHSERC
jgi:hypothetical protein